VESNRILLSGPETVFSALELAQQELLNSSLIRTAVLRYQVPAWGGPEAPPGKQVSFEAVEFLKSVALSQLSSALVVQAAYFDQINASKDCRRRNRYYLKQFVDWVYQKRWLLKPDPADHVPQFNRFSKPRGERRTYAQDLRTTGCKHPKSYALGTDPSDFCLVDGRQVLGNAELEQELKALENFGTQVLKLKSAKHPLTLLRALLGYLYRVRKVLLADLRLELLVPRIQLKFSEQDFVGNTAFSLSPTGQLHDPTAAEQTLAMAEVMAKRTAKKRASLTIQCVDDFFEWRRQILLECGQPEGLSPATKRDILVALILLAKYQYRGQTDSEENQDYQDIPVICRLRLKIAQFPLDLQKTQKQIRKRSVSWGQAMKVFERQRLQALEYRLASRNSGRGSNRLIRKRMATSIASDIQKTVILGLMVLIPTDRQQTYRSLEFGTTLKNGYFMDDDCEQFVSEGIPLHPDKAQFWINLETFKTAATYGEFWYPVPNIQFLDGTTFYQFIGAWLWGFWDESGRWPSYWSEENKSWQGYIDGSGNRQGWRAVLNPEHDFIFTMPQARTPFYGNTFSAIIKSIFVRFTQEDGVAVPVTPHSLRHMLATYLDRLGVDGEEAKSFAYVLHHSPEIHQGRYTYRNNQSRITPAVQRMERIIRSLI
jgi:hypothetical protein